MRNNHIQALTALSHGEAIVVIELTEDWRPPILVLAAEHATTRLVAFAMNHTAGLLTVALPAEKCERLDMPIMAQEAQCADIAYTVAVDAAEGIGTGISATDRSRTIRLLGAASTLPGDLTRPGHVLGARARRGGVLEHRGPAEVVVDLMGEAGVSRVGVSVDS
ncbi:3,4-dihydroxy-2-butanone-4-phosphate synthase [Rhodococcus sp. NPDC019627]|uniref:3,4-dihydroxy-2-butanone-4-phosphate synthase n=1 Tax=unclassified Rhodococcus (in: high G+C Gram-positive bacteria) TaxID=192944 RepID=UPI0033F39B72